MLIRLLNGTIIAIKQIMEFNMIEQEEYEVSDFHEKWLNETNCILGFTVTYSNGVIKNILRSCTLETYKQVLKEITKSWETYLNNSKRVIKKGE